MACLLLSEGTPMIVAGDEVLRTQRGNNNAYCQDNATSWMDWSLIDKNAEMLRFTQALIEFRKNQPNVRRPSFLTGKGIDGQLPDVSWFGPHGAGVDWTGPHKSLVCVLGTAGLENEPAARYIMIMLHAGGDPQEFVVPAAMRRLPWRMFLDTAAEAPGDIYEGVNGPAIPSGGKMRLVHHSMRVYVA